MPSSMQENLITQHKQITQPSIEACAITFMGNAKNKRQQDALYFLDTAYRKTIAIIPTCHWQGDFCVAVSDGVGSSPYSQHCSKAVVSAVGELYKNDSIITPSAVHKIINQALIDEKYLGASATLAQLTGKPIVQDESQNNDDASANTTQTSITIRKTPCYQLRLLHVGDSRIYYLPNVSSTSNDQAQWQCLTRDHNVLNDLLDDEAKQKGRKINPDNYNREGMASSLYTLTEYFTLEGDSYSQAPSAIANHLSVNSGDTILICSDGIHDLVHANDWPTLNADIKLDDWLQDLRFAVYESEGNAYDNGTAIVVRFN